MTGAKELGERPARLELTALVDTLLPGDDIYPPASVASVELMLIDRWAKSEAYGTIEDLVTLLERFGGPLWSADAEKRAAIVSRIESEHPNLFAILRRIVYLSYYQTSVVVDAIASRGHDYRLAPQPQGYLLPKFKMDDEAPRHRRGRYLRTEEVRRVDLTRLDHLTNKCML